jgi:hypothetical protein
MVSVNVKMVILELLVVFQHVLMNVPSTVFAIKEFVNVIMKLISCFKAIKDSGDRIVQLDIC